MMVDADLAAQHGGLVTVTVTRAFVTGIGGQDGSYLAERLLADGRRGARARARGRRRRRRTAPRRRAAPRRPDRRRRHPARCCSTWRPTRSTTWPAISSVAQSWEEPDLTGAGQRDRGGRAAGVRAAGPGAHRPAGALRAGLERRDLRRARTARPQDEATPIRPVNPYGAAKAYAHLIGRRLPRAGTCTPSALILYNHESPRRPTTLRHPQDHLDRRRDRPRRRPTSSTLGNLDARRDWGWAPDYVDAMVRAARADARRRLRRRHRREPLRRATSSPRRSPAPASPTGSRSSAPTPRSSARPTPTELVGDASQGPRASSAGRRRSASRSSSAGWSTPTSPRVSRRVARSSSRPQQVGAVPALDAAARPARPARRR